MKNINNEILIQEQLLNSIEREELLLKKYDEYNPNIEDYEIKELIKEFKETAHEHIDLLKSNLQKFSI